MYAYTVYSASVPQSARLFFDISKFTIVLSPSRSDGRAQRARRVPEFLSAPARLAPRFSGLLFSYVRAEAQKSHRTPLNSRGFLARMPCFAPPTPFFPFAGNTDDLADQ